MSVNKKDLFDLIEQLPDSAQRSAYDYLNFLVHDHEEKLDWEQLSRLAPDSVPLSEEEKQQLNSKEGFITGEEVKREFNLQIDLP
jgi:arylamine N-acetyltransferase